jgi:hypothetical protein
VGYKVSLAPHKINTRNHFTQPHLQHKPKTTEFPYIFVNLTLVIFADRADTLKLWNFIFREMNGSTSFFKIPA